MKIAHLLVTGGWGGAEGLACALARQAELEGHSVSVDAAPRAQPGLRGQSFAGAGDEATLFSWARGARRRLQAFAPDLVHVHLSTPAFAATALCAARGFPSLVSLHLLPENRWPRDFLTRLPSKWMLLLGAKIPPCWRLVVVSQTDQRLLRRAFGADVQVVLNAPYPVQPGSRDDSAEAFAGATLKLLCVGRLEPQKGIDRLLEALAPVARSLDFRLLVVGEGQQRAELMALRDRLGLGSRVHFLGASAWHAAGRQADLLLFPSRYEGMPLVPMEGVLAGCPVVLSSIPPHQELFSGIPDALLPEEVGAWPAVLQGLLSDAERRERLQITQRALAPRFGFARMWGEYLTQYSEVLERAAAPRAARALKAR